MDNYTKKDNVIIFPKTVEYYEIELTRMLESERYKEAVDLLQFLLECQTEDERSRDEWKSMLSWLQTMTPELISIEEEADWTESDLVKQHLQEKTAADGSYTDQLLGMMQRHVSLEKQLLSLDQLIHIDHPQINDTLIRWIHENEIHPLVQFKVLQTLKSRGMQGKLRLHKGKEIVSLLIEETPLSLEEFPSSLSEVLDRVEKTSEVNHPALVYFAQQTWSEFLAFIYGTWSYRLLLQMDEEHIDVWSAVFHYTLLQMMFGHADRTEIMEMYGVTSDMKQQWNKARKVMKTFTDTVLKQ